MITDTNPTMRPILILILLAIPLSAHAQAGRSILQDPLTLGLFTSGGIAFDQGGAAHRGAGLFYPGDTSRTSLLLVDDRASGLSMRAGLVVAADLHPHLRPRLAIDVEGRSATYRTTIPGALVLLPGEDPNNPEVVDLDAGEIVMEVEETSIGIGLDLAMRLFEDYRFRLFVTPGLRGRFLLSATDEVEIREGEDFEHLTTPDPRWNLSPPILPEERPRSEIGDAGSPQVSARAGILAEYWLDRRGQVTLDSEIAYEHGLTDLVPESGWQSQSLALSVGLSIRFGDRRLHDPIPACSGPEPEWFCE